MTIRLRTAMREHFSRYRFGEYKTEWVFHHVITRGRAKAGDRLASLKKGFEKARHAAPPPMGFRQHDLRHRRVFWVDSGPGESRGRTAGSTSRRGGALLLQSGMAPAAANRSAFPSSS